MGFDKVTFEEAIKHYSDHYINVESCPICDKIAEIIKNGKFLCKIYRKRLGTQLPDDGVCVDIQYCTHRAEHCPYNKFYGQTKV